MYGYAGKLLFVDLSKNDYEIRELTQDMAKQYLGGPGLGAKILYDEMPAKTDPFAPESMLGFVSGVLNGSSALFGGRYSVVSKSPVTGMWNDANAGGYFGPDLKKAGFDAVFVRGIAEKPVYIWIDNGQVEIRDASKYWGMMVSEAEEAFREDIGDKKINMAMIGPGGENLSYMSAVINDGHRAAARGGTGAVMGSKKLKAVVVRGTHKVEIADKAALTACNKAISDLMKGPLAEACTGFGDAGTAGTFDALAMANDAGIKNWGGKAFEDYSEEAAARVSTATMDTEFKSERYGCSTCPMRCGAMYKVDSEKWPMKHTGRPEYETVGAFASLTLVDNPVAVLKCNDLCNEGGLDTISVGGTVAWAMECYSNGLFTPEEVDGLELNWGNADAMVALVEKMVKGEGCGKVFGLGSMHASRTLGKGEQYLVTARGIEPPQHDSRLAPGLARTYRFDPTPCRHVKGTSNVGAAGMPDEVKYNYEHTGFDDLLGTIGAELDNSAGWCYFARLFGIVTDDTRPEILNAVTGFDYSRLDVHALGQRMLTLRHAFNLREGLTREMCTISPRLVDGNTEGNGVYEGISVDSDKLANNFFMAAGWTEDMIPTKSTLQIIGGLEPVIADLYPEN